MLVGRLLGWIIVVLGLVVLGRDIIGWVDTHRFEPISFGQLWVDFDRRSLDFAETMVRRFTSPALWDPAITTLLRLWAAPSLIVVGAALTMSGRRRERAARRRRR